MQHTKALRDLLSEYLPWHATRLAFSASFLLALLRNKTVNFVTLSLDLNPEAQAESSYRRIQRFFKDFRIDRELIARLLLGLLPRKDGFVVIMDRSNWRFGKLEINILMVAIAHEGIAFPVVWSLLPKCGNSHTSERITLMERFLQVVAAADIEAFLADREFIGDDWFAYLTDKHIPFHIRIRQDALCDGWLNVFMFFHKLPVGEARILRRPAGAGGLSRTGAGEARSGIGSWAMSWQ
jgi:hypothetical protein